MAPVKKTDPPANDFTFGAEIELLVKPKMTPSKFTAYLKKNKFDPTVPSQPDANYRPSKGDKEGLKLKARQDLNRTVLREALAVALKANRINAKAHGSKINDNSDYTVWSVMEESALDEPEGFWRVEFVSKVQSTMSLRADQQEESFVTDITNAFQTIHENCWVHKTTGCSMHVHIGRGMHTKFTDQELQSICKAICYFDHAITDVVPADRKSNKWCDSNCAGIKSESVHEKLREAYQQVLSNGWKRGLFDTYLHKSKVNKDTVYSIMQKGRLNQRQGRYVSWNFQHASLPCGTIEFRRPPGVDDAANALHWVAFTLGFVSQAILTDWNAKQFDVKGLRDFNKPDFKDLAKFVKDGIAGISSVKHARCSAEEIGLMNINPRPRGPPTLTAGQITERKQLEALEAEEDARIQRMQEMKAELGEDHSHFASKVNSAASTPVLGPQNDDANVDQVLNAVNNRLERLVLPP